jgi:hypothetical protein
MGTRPTIVLVIFEFCKHVLRNIEKSTFTEGFCNCAIYIPRRCYIKKLVLNSVGTFVYSIMPQFYGIFANLGFCANREFRVYIQ